MYIKIENNVLVAWANWEFKNSQFVDINYEDFVINPSRYVVKDGVLTDLSNSEGFKVHQRLKEIEEELKKLDELYYQAGQAPVDFEGHKYKFEWTSLYQGILQSGILPAKIWDISELEENAVVMDYEQLSKLQNCLLAIQESAFQTRKIARSILLLEKETLKNQIKE